MDARIIDMLYENAAYLVRIAPVIIVLAFGVWDLRQRFMECLSDNKRLMAAVLTALDGLKTTPNSGDVEIVVGNDGEYTLKPKRQ